MSNIQQNQDPKQIYTVEFVDLCGDTRLEHILLTDSEYQKLIDEFTKRGMQFSIFKSSSISPDECSLKSPFDE